MAEPILVKISELEELLGTDAADLLVMVDVSEQDTAKKTKKVRMEKIKLTNADQVGDGIISATKMATNVFPYTTAGDLAYLLSAGVLTRLAKGTTGQVLRMNADATAPEWANPLSGITLDNFNNTVEHTYNLSTWRDMPNSSKTITLVKKSTILCIGHCWEYANSGETYGFFEAIFNIDGTDINFGMAKRNYGQFQPINVPMFGYKTGVPAGNRVVKIRERSGAGAYTVGSKSYLIVIIPEE